MGKPRQSCWSWADALPIPPPAAVTELSGEPWRGRAGSGGSPRDRDKLCDAFLGAANQVRVPGDVDQNSGDQEGFGDDEVNDERGRRSSAAARPEGRSAEPHAADEPTSWACGSTDPVPRRDLRAGRYQLRGRLRPGSPLSAGTIQSPQILELSGISPADVLREAGVPGPRPSRRWRTSAITTRRGCAGGRDMVTFKERSGGLSCAGEIARYLICCRGLLSLPIALATGSLARQTASPDLTWSSFSPGKLRRRLKQTARLLPGNDARRLPLRRSPRVDLIGFR